MKEVRTFYGFTGWLLGGSSGLSFNEMFIGQKFTIIITYKNINDIIMV